MYLMPPHMIRPGARLAGPRRRGMRGLGVAITTSTLAPIGPVRIIRPGGNFNTEYGGNISPILAPISAPIIQQSQAQAVPSSTTTTTTPVAAAPITSGTPVPAGYPTNSIYVAPGGAFWEYDASSNSWINVGTPYNVGGTATSTTTTPVSTVATAGTPVPAGYPTGSLFTNTDGSVWQYSSTVGVWVEIEPPTAVTTTAAGAVVPAGTSTAVPYTDASGNVWTYNPTTGQWVMTESAAQAAAAGGGYQSILSWLSQSTLISGIPNWVPSAALIFVGLKLMQGKGR